MLLSPPETRLATLLDAFNVGVDQAAPLEATLRNAYHRELNRLAKTAARNFARHAITASAQPDPQSSNPDAPNFVPPSPPGWVMPDADEVLSMTQIVAQLTAATQPTRVKIVTAMMGDSLASVGVGFDVQNPLAQQVLGGLGHRITEVSSFTRASIMASLQDSFDKGLSIPHAAREMAKTVSATNIARATLIARTEFIGAQNASSLASVQYSGAAKFKVWLATGDARTRPDHAIASGQTVPLSDPFDVGGYTMQHPGDQNAPAREVCNCRCTMTYTDEPGQDYAVGPLHVPEAPLPAPPVAVDEPIPVLPGEHLATAGQAKHPIGSQRNYYKKGNGYNLGTHTVIEHNADGTLTTLGPDGFPYTVEPHELKKPQKVKAKPEPVAPPPEPEPYVATPDQQKHPIGAKRAYYKNGNGYKLGEHTVVAHTETGGVTVEDEFGDLKTVQPHELKKPNKAKSTAPAPVTTNPLVDQAHATAKPIIQAISEGEFPLGTVWHTSSGDIKVIGHTPSGNVKVYNQKTGGHSTISAGDASELADEAADAAHVAKAAGPAVGSKYETYSGGTFEVTSVGDGGVVGTVHTKTGHVQTGIHLSHDDVAGLKPIHPAGGESIPAQGVSVGDHLVTKLYGEPVDVLVTKIEGDIVTYDVTSGPYSGFPGQGSKKAFESEIGGAAPKVKTPKTTADLQPNVTPVGGHAMHGENKVIVTSHPTIDTAKIQFEGGGVMVVDQSSLTTIKADKPGTLAKPHAPAPGVFQPKAGSTVTFDDGYDPAHPYKSATAKKVPGGKGTVVEVDWTNNQVMVNAGTKAAPKMVQTHLSKLTSVKTGQKAEWVPGGGKPGLNAQASSGGYTYKPTSAYNGPQEYLPVPKPLEGVLDSRAFTRALAHDASLITDREAALAVKSYTGSSYAQLNRALRESKGKTVPAQGKQMDRAFAAVPPTHVSGVLYRGTNLSNVESAQNLQLGQVIHDDGFVSTTTNPARTFSGDKMVIEVPKGARVIDVNKTTGSHHESESEVLLNRGARFLVTKIDDTTRPRTIHVRLLVGDYKASAVNPNV